MFSAFSLADMEAETAEKIDEILQNLTDLRSSVTVIREHNSSIESRLDDIEAKVYEKPKINVRSEPSHVSFLNDCSTGITQGNSGQSSDINLDYFNFASPDDDLQSGPKVLDHSGVFIRDFPRSPFSMLIHTILARTPLLSATLRQGVGRGNSILRQSVWDYDSTSRWTKTSF